MGLEARRVRVRFCIGLVCVRKVLVISMKIISYNIKGLGGG